MANPRSPPYVPHAAHTLQYRLVGAVKEGSRTVAVWVCGDAPLAAPTRGGTPFQVHRLTALTHNGAQFTRYAWHSNH